MNFKPLYVIISVFVFFLGCDSKSKTEKEIAKIEIPLKVERFDQDFSGINWDRLQQLKKTYPFLFSKQYNDDFWIEKSNDSLEVILATEVAKAFDHSDVWQKDIINLFKHLKYYSPEFKTPRVIGVTSGVDYRNKTIVTDSIVLIALDNYMGAQHEFYQNIASYISRSMQKEYLVSDLAASYAKKHCNQLRIKTFMDEMIYRGKLLAFKDRMIPFVADSLKIKFTAQEMEWAKINEAQVWSYFIEKQLLFSTDQGLLPRFINPAPFSKFYLELDNATPGRIGEYIGWQIVKSYIKNNKEVSFKSFLNTNAEDIYLKSGYKPKR